MSKLINLSWSRYLPVGLTLCVGVGLSILSCVVVSAWENKRRNYEFNRYADSVASTVQQHFKEDLEVFPNVGDFVAATNYQINHHSFEKFVQRPLSDHVNLEYLAWMPRIQATSQSFKQQALIDQFLPTSQQTFPHSIILSNSLNSEYFEFNYIETSEIHNKRKKFNVDSLLNSQIALEQARDTGEMVIIGQSNFNNSQKTYQGLLVIQPIFSDDTDLRSRRATLEGFVMGGLRIEKIFKDALLKQGIGNLDLYLAETISSDKNQVPVILNSENQFVAFYNSATKEVEEFPVNVKGKVQEAIGTRTLEFGGRQWKLYLLSTPAYQEIQTKHWRSWAVLIIGLLWTHIPVTYLLTSLSRQRQIEQLAQERTQQADQLQQTLIQLSQEQKKSEQLLHSIFPQAIAKRLKEEQQTIADSFPEATVLFADIVGFTQLAARISPAELVQVLNEIFSTFDHLAAQHGLEKIKTIGDAYMVVGGVPMYRRDHVEAIAEMALDMQHELAKFDIKHGENLSMRIGIHTGPVIAGVIGTHKLIYDLWGDTVNTASRMESHGIAGCIQVSSTTYERLKNKYWLENRGPIQIKGKGEMTTYLLIGRHSNLTEESSFLSMSLPTKTPTLKTFLSTQKESFASSTSLN